MDNILRPPTGMQNEKEMKIKIHLQSLAIVVLLNSCQQSKTSEAKVESANVAGEMDRTVLPIKNQTIRLTQPLMPAMQRHRHVLK